MYARGGTWNTDFLPPGWPVNSSFPSLFIPSEHSLLWKPNSRFLPCFWIRLKGHLQRKSDYFHWNSISKLTQGNIWNTNFRQTFFHDGHFPALVDSFSVCIPNSRFCGNSNRTEPYQVYFEARLSSFIGWRWFEIIIAWIIVYMYHCLDVSAFQRRTFPIKCLYTFSLLFMTNLRWPTGVFLRLPIGSTGFFFSPVPVCSIFFVNSDLPPVLPLFIFFWEEDVEKHKKRNKKIIKKILMSFQIQIFL